MKLFRFFFLLMIFILSTSQNSIINNDPNNNLKETTISHIYQKFNSNSASLNNITIQSDSDFSSYKFPGTGTSMNPYLIQGYNLSFISISNVNASFIIQNNTVTGIGNGGAGIKIYNGKNFQIVNNTVSNFDAAIYLLGTQPFNATVSNNYASGGTFGIRTALINYNTSKNQTYNINIKNNVVSSHSRGIELDNVQNITINNNTINMFVAVSGYPFAIYLVSSVNCTVTNNILLKGILRVEGEYQNYIVNNTLNSLPIIYSLGNLVRPLPDQLSQVILINCSYLVLNGIHFYNDSGFYLEIYSSNNITIENSLLKNVKIVDSYNFKIINNNVYNDSLYFTISNCNDFVILNNSFTNNQQAIQLVSSYGINITNNTFQYNNYAGIILNGGQTTIINNLFKNNGYYGIDIQDPNSNFVLQNNSFIQNGQYALFVGDTITFCNNQNLHTISNNIYSGNPITNADSCLGPTVTKTIVSTNKTSTSTSLPSFSFLIILMSIPIMIFLKRKSKGKNY